MRGPQADEIGCKYQTFFSLNQQEETNHKCQTFFSPFSIQNLKEIAQNVPGMQETWVQSLGQEDPLEKEMATHSSILAWRIPQMEEPGRL